MNMVVLKYWNTVLSNVESTDAREERLTRRQHDRIKYFLANYGISGKSTSCVDHHFNGFLSGSMLSNLNCHKKCSNHALASIT